MGDGSAAFLEGINKNLEKIGSEYRAKVVGSCGYSRGEDKFMGPAEWKSNPQASRGGLVAGVLRDGDWNIAQKWLGDNGLRNNPNEKTWDPDALNWVAANDYIDAAQKYIAGYSEDRTVVRNGKPTGEKKRVAVNGVVTWTPGDVQVAQKKGGLVSIVSTKEYSSQMPNVIIGIDKWMRDNRSTVENFLQAVLEGGDAVKSNSSALSHAAKISQAVYKESGADAGYWEKYYRGTQEKDAQGVTVDLGGSTVNNLADDLLLFGLIPGSSNLFGATYKVFGDIVVNQYRDLVPSYPPVNQILDTSYVQAIAKREAPSAAAVTAAKPTYKPDTSRPAPVVSRKAWNIHFASGRATFVGDAQRDLDRMRRDLLIASGTTVEIHGHTDNVGDANANMKLSEDRAFAVKNWLMKVAPVNFPSSRIQVMAHGQTNPVASNSTEGGRSQNRRVEVVLKSSGT
jgi:outer membrane protein OmpA-like peptidoglycan-associated protein